jgi:tryptophan halogenase
MDNGWLWNIPQRHSDHIGYVFSSAHCSEEGARLELEERYPQVKIERLINFRSGRLERWISGNALAIGNAFGFVEPLESTALFMSTRQCLLVARNLRALAAGDFATAERLNVIGVSTWDYLRWFLAVHYRFNRRADTPFWRDCRSTVDVSGAEPILAQYQESAPRFGMEGASPSQLSTNFDTFGYDVLLLGQHMPVALRPPHHDIETHRANVSRLRLLTDAAMPQDRALSAVEKEGAAMLTRHVASNQAWLMQFNAHLAKVC